MPGSERNAVETLADSPFKTIVGVAAVTMELSFGVKPVDTGGLVGPSPLTLSATCSPGEAGKANVTGFCDDAWKLEARSSGWPSVSTPGAYCTSVTLAGADAPTLTAVAPSGASTGICTSRNVALPDRTYACLAPKVTAAAPPPRLEPWIKARPPGHSRLVPAPVTEVMVGV